MAKSVHTIGGLVATLECPSRSALFSVDVDTREVLKGSSFHEPLLQSKMALQRGRIFESRLAENDFARVREIVLTEHGVAVDRVVNLDECGDEVTSVERTKELIAESLESGVPLLLAEARIEAGFSNLRADFLLVARGGLVVMEAKSWPYLDGKPVDSRLFAKAVDQTAIYIFLLRRAGYMVSTTALYLAPRNIGYEPVAIRHEVDAYRLRKAEATLEASVEAYSRDLDEDEIPEAAWDVVDALEHNPKDRVRALRRLIKSEGSVFNPETCATSCGLVALCHDAAYRRGSLRVIGSALADALPSIDSLYRVKEIADGEVEAKSRDEKKIRSAAKDIEALRGLEVFAMSES